MSKNVMSKRRKWSLAALIALLLVLSSYVVAGPYLAINGIRNLVANGQYGELWRFVDYAQLRQSLGPQLQERIARGVIGHVGNSQTGQAIGEVTSLIAQPAIDAMVSPQGVATLLTGSALARSVTGQVDADGKARAIGPLEDADTRFESASLFTATVRNAEGRPVVFEFRRAGLSWKLAGMRLPE